MGTGVSGRSGAQRKRGIPKTGMRGGLGRTLLTAFLILTILPLALIGAYAARQNRRNLEDQVAAKLLSLAALKRSALYQWLETVQSVVSTSLSQTDLSYDRWWETWQNQMPEIGGVLLFDQNRHTVYAADASADCEDVLAQFSEAPVGSLGSSSDVWDRFSLHETAAAASLVIPIRDRDLHAVLCLTPSSLRRVLHVDAAVGETGRVALVTEAGRVWPDDEPVRMPGVIERNEAFSEVAASGYEDASGDRFIGAYYSVPGEDIGVLVEQRESEVIQSTDRMVATLIAMVLAVALATTAIAAVVIRQITSPVIDLTESAVAMAEGDLDQHLDVRSRDEIGILTYVFNEMAADLKSLYEDLEAKVAERTDRLQRANYQIQRRALHLQASQDVSQTITSIRDPETLLSRVTELIRDHFIYSSVAVYLVDPGGSKAELQAVSPRVDPKRNGSSGRGPWATYYRTGDGSVVERAIREGVSQLHNEPDDSSSWYPRTLSRLAVPLKMEDRSVGAIAVTTTAHEGIQPDELDVLESLANQVTIALENAHAYERERMAMEQMEAAEAFKANFLANMSHELREPLNTAIGFSRVLLKGIDGPLSERQRQDVEQIHHDSQHLLGLVNDILAISQIQAGLMELRLEPLDLADVVEGVLPTAGALIRGKEITLQHEVPPDLPQLCADPDRLRQVFVHLLNNAAKFTDSGEIGIRAWVNDGYVYVAVSDTGVGIPREDRERIFAQFEKGCGDHRGTDHGAGLGLALCREYVEMHGGGIWVDSEVGVGSTFTFSVPTCKPTCSRDAGDVISQKQRARDIEAMDPAQAGC